MTTPYDITPAFELVCYILTAIAILIMTAKPKAKRHPQQVFPSVPTHFSDTLPTVEFIPESNVLPTTLDQEQLWDELLDITVDEHLRFADGQNIIESTIQNSAVTAFIEPRVDVKKSFRKPRTHNKDITTLPTIKVQEAEASTHIPIKANAFKLREMCSEHQIKWRNANGKNKHMTVKEMKAQLFAKTGIQY